MYSVSNNLTYITGQNGIYDNKIKNDSVRYGRNAYNNYETYLADYTKENFPPLNYSYNYMICRPGQRIDGMALMGNAYEELGKKTQIKTSELTQKLQEGMGSDQFSADAIDINKDGYVDIGEYATTTLVQDMLSGAKDYEFNPYNISGTINDTGSMKAMKLANKKCEKVASMIFTQLHEDYALDNKRKEFISDKNNLV